MNRLKTHVTFVKMSMNIVDNCLCSFSKEFLTDQAEEDAEEDEKCVRVFGMSWSTCIVNCIIDEHRFM